MKDTYEKLYPGGQDITNTEILSSTCLWQQYRVKKKNQVNVRLYETMEKVVSVHIFSGKFITLIFRIN